MTTTRTYTCNLCRETIDGGSGVGVWFTSGHIIEQKHVRDAENHICIKCVHEIKRLDPKECAPPDGPHAVVFKTSEIPQ